MKLRANSAAEFTRIIENEIIPLLRSVRARGDPGLRRFHGGLRPCADVYNGCNVKGGEVMTGRSESAIHSFTLPDDQRGLRETTNLIESGQYDQLAELLRLSQAASERVGQSFLAEMFSELKP